MIFPYMFRALCAHHQKVKIVLYSIWYHHTETSEWSKITKIQFCKYNKTCRIKQLIPIYVTIRTHIYRIVFL